MLNSAVLTSDTVNRLPFFAGQPVIRVLPLAGHSHNNWQVVTRQQAFFLRQYQPGRLQQNRLHELKCQLKAAGAGIAPEVLQYYRSPGILITRFLPEARHFSYDDISGKRLAAQLARFHQLAVKVPLLNSVAYLQQLKQAVITADLFTPAVFDMVLQAAIQHAALEQDIVLCHRDLNCGNILCSHDHIYLIDFEYACLADYSFDLAAVSVHNQLDDIAERQWLAHYAGYRQLADTQDNAMLKVRLAKIIYCGWCWLWYLAEPDYHIQARHWLKLLLQAA